MPSKRYALCSISAGAKYNAMKAKLYMPRIGGLPNDYTAFCPFAGHLAAYAAKSGRLDVYANPAPGKGFGKPVATQTIATGLAFLQPFQLGTVRKPQTQMAVGYDSTSGVLQFYAIDGTSFDAKNTYKSFPALTTLLPYLSWDGSYLLCYDMTNGHVTTYSLAAGTGGDVTVTAVWKPTKPWAKGWTRFGPFRFGPENFFIKTNIDAKHTYIDHLMDDAGEGSHPAAENLPLPLNLAAVATFTLDSDPCFATYAPSGAVELNRFRGDVQGWFTGAKTKVMRGARFAVALESETPVVLFY